MGRGGEREGKNENARVGKSNGLTLLRSSRPTAGRHRGPACLAAQHAWRLLHTAHSNAAPHPPPRLAPRPHCGSPPRPYGRRVRRRRRLRLGRLRRRPGRRPVRGSVRAFHCRPAAGGGRVAQARDAWCAPRAARVSRGSVPRPHRVRLRWPRLFAWARRQARQSARAGRGHADVAACCHHTHVVSAPASAGLHSAGRPARRPPAPSRRAGRPRKEAGGLLGV